MTDKKRLNLLACFVVGLCLLLSALYLLVTKIRFVYSATVFEGPIVEVRREFVAKGKGSAVAYVPIVEIPDATGRKLKIRVQTFSEDPLYHLGDKMSVLCDLSSLNCIANDFEQKWGDFTLAFVLSLVFLSIPLVEYWRVHRERGSLANVKPSLRV